MTHVSCLHRFGTCSGSGTSSSSKCPASRQQQHIGSASIPHLWNQSLSSRHPAQYKRHRCQQPMAAAAAAAAADMQPSQAAAVAGVQEPLIRLTKRKRQLSWQKWERKLFEQLLEVGQEQALTASGDSDEWYYSYWDCPDAHLPVLQDAPYQAAWERALAAAAPLLQDAVVLDIGCAMGTLAMAAAKAGAKHVYAVDASPGAADLARKVIAANGLSSKVTVITGRAELVELPVRKVDVLLCDWMGSMLLHDSLLPAVLRARDRWLAPGGIIMPDAARLFVTGVDDKLYLGDQTKLWGNRRMGPGDGFNLKPVLNAVIKHPRVDSMSRGQLVTDAQQLLSLNLYSIKLQDLSFKQGVQLTAQRPERVSGLVTHFDVAWTCRGQLEGGVAAGPIFSTGPLAASTSWLQTVFSFPKPLKMEVGQQLGVSFHVDPNGLPPGRMLNVSVDVEFQGMKATVPYQLKR